ncbi:hypothetical protein O3G_MSEX013358, partial [Manduca sexta]
MKKRRESVASVYKKTTKFLSSASLLKKMPNARKNRSPTKTEEFELNEFKTNKAASSDEDSDNDLDYYLGVRKEQKYWRDPSALEQIKKDYLIYHCGVTEEDYNMTYRKTAPEIYHKVKRRLKQMPFKIHRKKKSEVKDESWRDRGGFFKLFAHRRDSEYSTSDSYSDCDSEERVSERNTRLSSGGDSALGNVVDDFNKLKADDIPGSNIKGVRIKEVSDGRPCENCPELCPGFIGHAW